MILRKRRTISSNLKKEDSRTELSCMRNENILVIEVSFPTLSRRQVMADSRAAEFLVRKTLTIALKKA
jgi:hypothetical protein